MKSFFRNFIALIGSVALIMSCSTDLYDYDELNDRMEIFDKRLAELEDWCKETNTNINSLKALVESLIQHDVITAVTPVLSENVVTGYTITFLNGDPITLYNGLNGKDGQDGADGEDGKDGENGQDGTNGRTPLIGVKQDTDGHYYWTLDGNWLTDAQGTKIKAQGEKGANGTNGENGQDGKNGVSPKLKIEEDGYWYISYDNEQTWTKLYKAVGEDGQNGVDGKPGADGKPGEDGKSFFESIDTTDDNFVLFKFTDGSTFKVPTWTAFEALQTQCNTMNMNLVSLQTIVTALGEKDYVTSVAPNVNEEGVEIGYIIIFSKSGAVSILHGKNGQDGQEGKPGTDGTPGKDGYTPIISIAQDTDGLYYWKLDGEWMLVNGNKVKAQGEKGDKGDDGAAGEAGSSGSAGTNGITPKLKIEDGFWHVSYDGGETWEQMSDENAVSGNNLFKSVTVNEGKIVFVMNDNTEVVVPIYQEIGIAFQSNGELSGIAANEVI